MEQTRIFRFAPKACRMWILSSTRLNGRIFYTYGENQDVITGRLIRAIKTLQRYKERLTQKKFFSFGIRKKRRAYGYKDQQKQDEL